ncbi:hypothetical protein [Salmonirosea aquatica]|uniref:DUF4136 domain-containing protein n=1 Tax=Salmonirosea aquatica TaxID=2654236 RepID=A0A7C9BG18_9BACT|nr:hypothetical protein [Cytophagaceae bacterium SJW1-29]
MAISKLFNYLFIFLSGTFLTSCFGPTSSDFSIARGYEIACPNELYDKTWTNASGAEGLEPESVKMVFEKNGVNTLMKSVFTDGKYFYPSTLKFKEEYGEIICRCTQIENSLYWELETVEDIKKSKTKKLYFISKIEFISKNTMDTWWYSPEATVINDKVVSPSDKVHSSEGLRDFLKDIDIKRNFDKIRVIEIK